MSGTRGSPRLENGTATLENILEHDQLFEAYPQLRDVKIRIADLEDGEDGSYNPETNTITLSRAGMHTTARGTTAHEWQHAIQEIENFASGSSPAYWARKDYESGDMVGNRLQEQHDRLIHAQSREDQNKYFRYQELERELERLFMSDEGSEGGRRYTQLEAQQDALYEELYPNQWFRDLLDLDRKMTNPQEVYYDLYRNTAGEIEARDVANRLDMTDEERMATRADLEDALAGYGDAAAYVVQRKSEGYDGMMISDGDEDSYVTFYPQQAKRTSDKNPVESEPRYSLSRTTDNKPFVEVEQDILAGVPEKDWASTVRNNLKDKFPDGIPLWNNEIRIDKQSQGEMTSSGYTKWLRYNDPQTRADKLRATNNADEILHATTDWVNEGLNHPRKDKIEDFARGEVLLRVGGNDYTAEVLVGKRKNGSMVMYDVLNLQPTAFTEKETNAVTTTNPSPGTDRNTASISDASVASNAASVKPELSDETRYSLAGDTADGLDLSQTRRRLVNRTMNHAAKELRGLIDADTRAAREVQQNQLAALGRDILQKGSVPQSQVIDAFETIWAAGRQVDTTARDDAQNIRDYLRQTGVSLAAQYRADVNGGDWNGFRRRNFGRLKITTEGLPVDVAYAELSGQRPDLFPADITNPADQIQRMGEVAHRLQPQERDMDSLYGSAAKGQIEAAFIDLVEQMQQAFNPRARTFTPPAEWGDAEAEEADALWRLDVEADGQPVQDTMEGFQQPVQAAPVRLDSRAMGEEELAQQVRQTAAKYGQEGRLTPRDPDEAYHLDWVELMNREGDENQAQLEQRRTRWKGEAQKMQAAGASREEILMRTGWI